MPETLSPELAAERAAFAREQKLTERAYDLHTVATRAGRPQSWAESRAVAAEELACEESGLALVEQAAGAEPLPNVTAFPPPAPTDAEPE